MFSTDVQYLHARDDSFTYQVAAGTAPPYTNCTVSPTTQTAGGIPLLNVNCAGLPGYNSPTITVNLGLEQTIPFDRFKLVVGANTQHKSSYYTYFDYENEQIQRAYWQTDVNVSFGPRDDRWSVGGFVRNVENNRLLVAPVSFANLIAAYTSSPRTYGGRVSVKF